MGAEVVWVLKVVDRPSPNLDFANFDSNLVDLDFGFGFDWDFVLRLVNNISVKKYIYYFYFLFLQRRITRGTGERGTPTTLA